MSCPKRRSATPPDRLAWWARRGTRVIMSTRSSEFRALNDVDADPHDEPAALECVQGLLHFVGGAAEAVSDIFEGDGAFASLDASGGVGGDGTAAGLALLLEVDGSLVPKALADHHGELVAYVFCRHVEPHRSCQRRTTRVIRRCRTAPLPGLRRRVSGRAPA